MEVLHLVLDNSEHLVKMLFTQELFLNVNYLCLLV